MKPARGSTVAAMVCFFVFPVLFLAGGPGSAMAAENECDILLSTLSETGEVPAIIIDPVNETVKIVTSRGVCAESIEAWSKREPLKAGKPSPEKTTKKPAGKQKKRTAPAQVIVKPVAIEKPAPAPAPEPAQVIVKPVAIEKPAPAPVAKPEPASQPVLQPVAPAAPPGPALPVKIIPQARSCDYRLKEVWDSQVLVIEGIKHWLSRAFTLDLDSNRQVDNVSFTFVAKGGTKKVIHYFGAAGELSGRSYPALKLPQESVIKRLCFDDVTYGKPKFFEDAPLKAKWIEIDKPDLAGEMDARERGVTYKKKTKKKKKKKPEKESTPWWIWALIGTGILAVAGGLWVFLGGKDEDDDGEKDDKDSDDEDDGDGGEKPRKSKFSLGGLFKRLKKKKKGGDDDDDDDDRGLDDDEDDDGGGKKKKKSKFSLGGLFKRKKKKKKGDDEEDEDDRGFDDDEDDDGGGKKKKKSKFSLGGLFKRKKKKKGGEDEDEDDEDEKPV